MSPKSAMRPHQRRTSGQRYPRKTSLQPRGFREEAVEEEDQQPRSQSVEDMLDTSSRSPSPQRLQRTVSEEQLSAPQRRRSFRHRQSPPPEEPQDEGSETASSAAASTSAAAESKKRNFVDRLASKVRSMMRK